MDALERERLGFLWPAGLFDVRGGIDEAGRMVAHDWISYSQGQTVLQPTVEHPGILRGFEASLRSCSEQLEESVRLVESMCARLPVRRAVRPEVS